MDISQYRFEENRLKSFNEAPTWPSSSVVSPSSLASAGLYRVADYYDGVRCFECFVVIYNWTIGDIPWNDHQRFSPRCRFVRCIPCGNVPIGVDPSIIPQFTARSCDVTGWERVSFSSIFISFILHYTKLFFYR